jgi:two-component system OmpR family response regulator
MIPQPLRILFFDDDEDTREMTRLFLNAEGFEAVDAVTAEDFFRLAQPQSFDVYMLDNCMPDLSGTELCQRIRELDDHTPIVFYSGAVLPSNQAAALAAGAQAYVTKPHLQELIDTLRQVVSESKHGAADAATI